MVETRNGRRFAVLFFVAAFLVLLLGRWLAPVDNAALTISAPFNSAITGVSNWVAAGVSGLFDGPRLQAEIAALSKQNSTYLMRSIHDVQLRRENAVLRSMVGFKKLNPSLDLLPADVIGSDTNSLAPFILINRGTRDSLHDGMTVVDQHGYFVGVIVDVTLNDARVQLMLSPSLSVGAVDLRTNATGLVEGQYAGAPRLDDVLESSAVQVGDVILTSGQYNLFPKSLLLGQVAGVTHHDVNIFQTAQIQPAADFRNLTMVSVVRNFSPAVPARLVTGQ